jgi:hypothetical protein
MQEECELCKAEFETDKMVELGNRFVCLDCKPLFVQHLKEGVPEESISQLTEHDPQILKERTFLSAPYFKVLVLFVCFYLPSFIIIPWGRMPFLERFGVQALWLFYIARDVSTASYIVVSSLLFCCAVASSLKNKTIFYIISCIVLVYSTFTSYFLSVAMRY